MDDVLIDAPYIITEEMIQSLNISIVVTGTSHMWKLCFVFIVRSHLASWLCNWTANLWLYKWVAIWSLVFSRFSCFVYYYNNYIIFIQLGAVETKRKFRSDSSDGSDSDGRGKSLVFFLIIFFIVRCRIIWYWVLYIGVFQNIYAMPCYIVISHDFLL